MTCTSSEAPRPPLVADADVVVLAGDIGRGVSGLKAAIGWWPERPIVYVTGNHEPYGHGLPALTGELRAAAAGSLLERDDIVIGGVRFLGCTLWSDFDVAGRHERRRAMAVCAELSTTTSTSRGRRRRAGCGRTARCACTGPAAAGWSTGWTPASGDRRSW